MHQNIGIGIIPGYVTTTLWISINGIVKNSCIMSNVKLFPFLWSEIDTLFIFTGIKQDQINYVALFTGPAPATTMRTLCAWVQAWKRAKENLDIVLLEGMKCIMECISENNEQEVLILQAYGGYAYWYNNFEKKETRMLLDQAYEKLIHLPNDVKIYVGPGVLIKAERIKQKTAPYIIDVNFANKISHEHYLNNKKTSEISSIKPYIIL